LQQLGDQIKVKVSSVAFSNAVAHPDTVMVVSCHTLVARFTVLGPQRLL